jgi:hypothetical protein
MTHALMAALIAQLLVNPYEANKINSNSVYSAAFPLTQTETMQPVYGASFPVELVTVDRRMRHLLPAACAALFFEWEMCK